MKKVRSHPREGMDVCRMQNHGKGVVHPENSEKCCGRPLIVMPFPARSVLYGTTVFFPGNFYPSVSLFYFLSTHRKFMSPLHMMAFWFSEAAIMDP